MAQEVIQKYREIFQDHTLDDEENEDLHTFFQTLNPPPDIIIKLRAYAFRIACEFLCEDHDTNVALLRCINSIVHTIETTCMVPKEENEEEEYEDDFESMYRNIYDNQVIDEDECQEFADFLASTPLPSNFYVKIRGMAIRIGSEYLTDDMDANVSLFKSINAVVHHLELAYLKPKEFELNLDISMDEISVENLGAASSLEKALQLLWNLDGNRLVPNEDYYLNVQEGKKPYHKDDIADEPLLASVDEKQFRRATYKSFIALLDNFVADTTEDDCLSDEQLEEVDHFLECLLQTAPMQFCHRFLSHNCPDNVSEDISEFKQYLHKIWFTNYSRSRGKRNSSGFEHVFVGEIKNEQVSGFHNWIQFYLEEQKGNVDYRGYIKPRNQSDNTNDDDHVLTLQFTWHGMEKFVGTMLIGVSPEFEMALYTICFLLGEEGNELRLDTGCDVFLLEVACHEMYGMIGSCFVKALEHED